MRRKSPIIEHNERVRPETRQTMPLNIQNFKNRRFTGSGPEMNTLICWHDADLWLAGTLNKFTLPHEPHGTLNFSIFAKIYFV